ncbi:hypothetical protein C1637_07985 [Chryseobacterium lactis]|uniref:Copper resistance protein NlpE n=1 Tax=Chryseobacterium lactis TaxID=1241981 RepID=A0A3G6RCX2_CHRLC|nr:hypothetical protein [Chryseobacterium lactis]AZA82521.1 hypothetical protein EG342_11710 [Chryseobacterium lactis]AZB02902.1 hypothetical protein EG341_02570 [Chryseobacterium lactis]PNW13803.1 hypothetical protein C1637_07985 [Chryseobacterium lactis]
MKYLIILFSAFLLIACKKEKETVSTSNPGDSLSIVKDSAAAKHSEGKILVGNIPFPKEIKECSCYFAINKADFESEKYIYADDAGKTAYMMLDGKRVAMNLISSSDMEVDEELTKEIENDNYKISVKGKKIKGEEALLFEGTLTIEKPDGTVFTTPIYGECGC